MLKKNFFEKLYLHPKFKRKFIIVKRYYIECYFVLFHECIYDCHRDLQNNLQCNANK